MKKFTALIIMTALLCTGCSNSDTASGSSASDSATSAVDSSSPADISQSTEAGVTAQSFKAGVWDVETNNIPTGYYTMYDDGKSGSTLEFDMGTGVDFEYEIGTSTVIFRFGDTESETVFNCTESDGSGYYKFSNDEGNTLEIRYNPALKEEELFFYSNMNLCELALDYYIAHYNYAPNSVAVQCNEDGTVTLHLYDNLGDHNSTYAWFTVDRFTAKGTDDTNQTEINLTE